MSGKNATIHSSDGGGPAAAFTSNDKVLSAARRMFRAREYLGNMEADFSADQGLLEAMRVEAVELTRSWHRSLTLSPPEQLFAGRCRKHRFNRIEREILVALVLEKLALVKRSVAEFGEMLDFLCLPDHRVMSALRAMGEEGRLFRAGLIEYRGPGRGHLQPQDGGGPGIRGGDAGGPGRPHGRLAGEE